MPLPRTGWVASASASHAGNPPSYTIDGSGSTRWTPGVSPVAGQWFEIDMASMQTFRELSIDAGATWNMDYLRGCDVTVSNDGSTWGSSIASAMGASQVVVIPLPTTTARYVRVTLNSSATSTTHWWSIAEFNVLN
jgi:hypothetical protein